MTCIVGIEHAGKVYLGGDSAGSDGQRLVIMAEPKVFKRGRFVIGYTTSFRMGQLLQHTLKPPAYTAEWQKRGLHAFMTVRVVDAIRKCFTDGGWMSTKNDRIEGGQFLIGFLGHLYVIESDFQVGRVVDGYYAVGSGAELAMGSLWTCLGPTTSRQHDDDDSTRDAIRLALGAAAHHAVGVAGPFTVEVA